MFGFNSEKKQAAMISFDHYLDVNSFSTSKKQYINSKHELYLDNDSKKWFIKQGKYDSSPKMYSYSDLIEFEVYEDGDSIAKGTTKGKTKGKGGHALVGGLLFGPVGAIVGASGKRKTKEVTKTITQEYCKILQVRIKVNDIAKPEIIIPLIEFQTKKDSFTYNSRFNTAKELAANLAFIQENAEFLEADLSNDDSLADELEKLHSLMQKGILTEEEFSVKKKQLLGL